MQLELLQLLLQLGCSIENISILNRDWFHFQHLFKFCELRFPNMMWILCHLRLLLLLVRVVKWLQLFCPTNLAFLGFLKYTIWCQLVDRIPTVFWQVWHHVYNVCWEDHMLLCGHRLEPCFHLVFLALVIHVILERRQEILAFSFARKNFNFLRLNFGLDWF